MLKVTFELKDNVDVDDFLAHHKDSKRVKKVSVSGTKKTAAKKSSVVSEPMTEYYSKGKQLSVKEFKARIKKAEQDIKEGRFYTAEEMMQKHEEWKRERGLTK
jgi:predicted transcriptional regulator